MRPSSWSCASLLPSFVTREVGVVYVVVVVVSVDGGSMLEVLGSVSGELLIFVQTKCFMSDKWISIRDSILMKTLLHPPPPQKRRKRLLLYSSLSCRGGSRGPIYRRFSAFRTFNLKRAFADISTSPQSAFCRFTSVGVGRVIRGGHLIFPYPVQEGQQ